MENFIHRLEDRKLSRAPPWLHSHLVFFSRYRAYDDVKAGFRCMNA